MIYPDLRQVHLLYGEEWKRWLGRARFLISHKHFSGLLPGKTYFAQQILERNRIVYEEQKVFAFIGNAINGKNVMKA